MNAPFLTFIVPVYNKERYIQRCLVSLIDQSFVDFEIIIVNDGSTDSSLDIIQSFSDKRIHCFSQTNQGVSAARNKGIKEAKGEYIIFVDSDDYVKEDFAETLHQLWVSNPAVDLYLFGLTKCDKKGTVLGKFVSEVRGYQSLTSFYSTFMQEQGRKGVYGYVSTKMIRREFLEKYQVRFDESIRLAEDYNFYLDIYMKNPRLFFSDYCGYFYIQDAENSSCQQKYVDYLSLIKIWLKTYDFLKDKEGASDNIEQIYKKIVYLNEAHFLQMQQLRYTDIKSSLEILHNLESHTDALNWKFNRLQKFISEKRVFSLYMYLLIRKLYHAVKSV